MGKTRYLFFILFISKFFKLILNISVVQGEGFEPPKAKPDDLQSPLVDRLSIPAHC